MRRSLDIIAGILDDAHDAGSFPWQDVTYRESMAVRIALAKRYKASTVNKMLSALRGVLVLKQTWRLGLIDADAYRCAADSTPKGARDAAMLAVFYGCGLRRRQEETGTKPFSPPALSFVTNLLDASVRRAR